ncbi:unnamed protein product [Rotaria socialis]|uniref:Uncharacterized protein n=1 Tax=Rotaria socialis TaxID=392032 RepID=A0A818N7N2_9BILA|nr:unnamed protein product [Rotaria socialis]
MSSLKRNLTKKEIATALIILKVRHRLTTVAISNICRLLRLLDVPNAPKSFSAVKRLIEQEATDKIKPDVLNICHSCNSVFKTTCDNQKCQSNNQQIRSPNFLKFLLKDQIQLILESENNFTLYSQLPSLSNDHIGEIQHADWYRSVAENENGSNFITLLLNVDGIAISGSSDISLWIFTFIINEIKRSDRYKLQNCILGGVWPGPKKPSREQIYAMLKSMTDELQLLENENVYIVRVLGNQMIKLKVFLIGSTCDKPAQAIVQNIAEPIGKYGCGRCEIPGITVPSRKGANHHIRVFPLSSESNDKPQCRSNKNYDTIMALKNPTEDERKGYLGQCALRFLKHFDVGQSFLSDSLHNLYGGAMKKLLKLWFSDEYKKSEWSSFTQFGTISKQLYQYRYPSTTSRTPRPLIQFHRFKANEFRLILLFGAPVFKRYLKPKIYKNYLLLVFALHLAEFRSLRSTDIDDIRFLLDSFLYEYPSLYTNRHNQQVIHSIDHVAQSVQDYGQLSNYSTFNFDYLCLTLGMVRATVHSTKCHAQEIANTMNLLRLAVRNTLLEDFSNELKTMLEQIQRKKRVTATEKPTIQTQHHSIKLRIKQTVDETLYKDIQEIFRYDDIQLYQIVSIGTTRFTTRDFAKAKKNDDSCVLYRFNKSSHIGFIEHIVRANQKIFFKIKKVTIKENLTCTYGNRKFQCRNISMGSYNNDENVFFIKPEDIIEKLVHYQEAANSFYFFRFPTLCESS